MAAQGAGSTPSLASARVWLPPPAVTEHTGTPLSPDYDFFASPPDGIGEIRSAYSVLKKGENVNTPSVRLRSVGISAAFGVGVAIVLEGAVRLLTTLAESTHLPRAFWAALPGALLAILFWRLTRSRGLCNYVGSTGCAEIVGAASGDKLIRQRIVQFQDAEGLVASVSRHFERTEYRYTEYSFRWYPRDGGGPCFEITGSHAANLESPPPANYYHFGRAAEAAWCAYRAPILDFELAQHGYLRFKLGSDRALRVGQAFLELEEADGARYRAEASEIGSVKVESARLTLARKEGASGFFGKLGERGIISWDLSSMHNSRLFLLAFEKLLGLKVV